MYNPKNVEQEILEFWEKKKTFDKLMKKLEKSKKKFSFYEGPPTANNEFGVHHALGRTYKDLFLRYKAMQGYRQRRQAGFDAQGLWVEVEVEKALGLKDKHEILKYGLEKFAGKCKDRVKSFIDNSWVPLSKKLGMWMDWENAYITSSDHNNEYVWLFLKTAHEKGWLYKGNRSMPWCGRCACTMAQHEVLMGYKEISHDTVYMKFPIKDRENEFLLVWTTTPWTVSADVAVAVHPEKYYAKVKQGKETYYLSENRVDILTGKYEIIDRIIGADLVNVLYTMPYSDFDAQKNVTHRIISWDLVSDEEGTGIVHIAPGCGPEDFELGQQERLPIVAPLDEDANFKEGFDWQTGKGAQEVDKLALKDMDKRGFLYKTENYKHNYPHCWRCSDPLVFRVVDQWFVSSKELKSLLIKKMKETKWEPEWVKTKRMMPWLENMRDWAVSRTRYYGSPIPVWVCKDCEKYEVIGSKKELKKKAIKGFSQLKELHRPWIDKVILKCPSCGGEAHRIEETGDVWMDAGVMPFSTLNYKEDKKYWKEWFPADFITEMHEQIRGWYYLMAFIGGTLVGEIPYKNVLNTGMVLAEDGREMHKSWGNAIFAREALEKIGADPMRWVYCNGEPGAPLKFGYGPGEEARRNLNVLWNFAKFVDTYLDLKPTAKPKSLTIEDKWILSRLETVKKEVTEALDNMHPHTAIRTVANFYLNDLSRFYGHLIREPLSTGSDKDKTRLSYVLRNCLLDTLKLMAPFVPFITEKIYLDYFVKIEKTESIHLFDWPKADPKLINKKLEIEIEIAREALTTILACREKMQRNIRWPIKTVTVISKDTAVRKAAESQADLIKELANIVEIKTAEKSGEITRKVKPDYATLAPRYQEKTPEIIRLITEKSPSSLLDKIYSENKYQLEVSGEKINIFKNDLIIDLETPDDKIALEGKNFTVLLEKEETSDMLSSGYAREIARKIQALRKRAGLKKPDRIKLALDISDDLRQWLEPHLNYIKEKVGATEIQFGKEVVEHGEEFNVKDQEIKMGFDVLNKQ